MARVCLPAQALRLGPSLALRAFVAAISPPGLIARAGARPRLTSRTGAQRLPRGGAPEARP